MLVFGLERIPRFFMATSLLTYLSETAHLQCTKSMFSLIISHNSPYFLVVALRISPTFFYYYIVTEPEFFNWRIPINKICNIFRNGLSYPAMVFTVYNENPPRALLTFRDSSIGTFGRAMFSSRMTLSHEEDHQEDLGNVDIATFVTIDSEELRRLSRELIILDKVLVTLTNSQVMFSNPFKALILTKRKGECITGGIENGEEIKFIISLKPELLYTQLTFRSKRVWMYKSSKGRGIIYATLDLNARVEIYFPYLNM